MANQRRDLAALVVAWRPTTIGPPTCGSTRSCNPHRPAVTPMNRWKKLTGNFTTIARRAFPSWIRRFVVAARSGKISSVDEIERAFHKMEKDEGRHDQTPRRVRGMEGWAREACADVIGTLASNTWPARRLRSQTRRSNTACVLAYQCRVSVLRYRASASQLRASSNDRLSSIACARS